ncbi:hypothetical protein [Halobacteriovorax sp.]|uniref:hypothetical protein n=1 Tax=Halobacteriovorax sp. TaxID=2020862 RepID=UPI0035679763
MNDQKLKDLIKNDKSAPKTPKNELDQIYQKIEDDASSIMNLLNIKSFALSCCLIIVVSGVKFSITELSTQQLTEVEQQELIEYMLEDQYLSNTDSSYAWVDESN